MLLALQVIVHLFGIFEHFLARLASVFLNGNLLIVTFLQCLLLLLSIPRSNLLPVLPQLLLLLQPLLLFLLFLPLSLGLLLPGLNELELLIPWVTFLDVLEQFDYGLIELFALGLTLLLVLGFYQALDSSVRCLVRIVFISIGEDLSSGKVLPLRVETEDLF